MANLKPPKVQQRHSKQPRRPRKKNGRSHRQEILIQENEHLDIERPSPEEMLARIRALRSRIKVPPLTESFLRRAKNLGRM